MSQAAALMGQVMVCADVGSGASGVTYAAYSGRPMTCGADAEGNVMYVVVDQAFSTSDARDTQGSDGTVAGLAIGAAVLGVMAVASSTPMSTSVAQAPV